MEVLCTETELEGLHTKVSPNGSSSDHQTLESSSWGYSLAAPSSALSVQTGPSAGPLMWCSFDNKILLVANRAGQRFLGGRDGKSLRGEYPWRLRPQARPGAGPQCPHSLLRLSPAGRARSLYLVRLCLSCLRDSKPAAPPFASCVCFLLAAPLCWAPRGP